MFLFKSLVRPSSSFISLMCLNQILVLCKYIRFVMPNELHYCRLWIAFGELTNTYYRDEGRRAKARLEKKNYTSVELNVRYCFKVRFLL